MLLENSGDIQIGLCAPYGPRSTSTIWQVRVGDVVSFFFTLPDPPEPPYSVQIRSPTGRIVVDTIVRDIPTAAPDSGPVFQFVASASGRWRLMFAALMSRAKGEAMLRVS